MVVLSFVPLMVVLNCSGTGCSTKSSPLGIITFISDDLAVINSSMAAKAYETWADASGEDSASLPPERFRFYVSGTDIREV